MLKVNRSPPPEQIRLDRELWKDGRSPPASQGELRFVIVCRAVLGVFVQVGAQRTKQLNSDQDLFAAGSRELALILARHADASTRRLPRSRPCMRWGTRTPKRVAPRCGSASSGLHPTLMYPEYIVAYRRV